jgi:hypothetical protein
MRAHEKPIFRLHFVKPRREESVSGLAAAHCDDVVVAESVGKALDRITFNLIATSNPVGSAALLV